MTHHHHKHRRSRGPGGQSWDGDYSQQASAGQERNNKQGQGQGAGGEQSGYATHQRRTQGAKERVTGARRCQGAEWAAIIAGRQTKASGAVGGQPLNELLHLGGGHRPSRWPSTGGSVSRFTGAAAITRNICLAMPKTSSMRASALPPKAFILPSFMSCCFETYCLHWTSAKNQSTKSLNIGMFNIYTMCIHN